MTRDELVNLLADAIALPGQYARPETHGPQESYTRWAARAVLAALRAPEGEPHLIDVRDEGWTMSHPLQCRLDDLFTCEVTRAAELLDLVGLDPGRYAVTVDNGVLVIGEAVA